MTVGGHRVEDQTPESVTLGGIVGYAFVSLSLLAVLLIHLPWLPLQAQAAGHQFTNLIGQEHRWTMFAPDPRGTSIYLEVDLEHVHGSSSTWTIDAVSTREFRRYRWVKWSETVVLERNENQLEGLAAFLSGWSTDPIETMLIRGIQRVRPDPGGPRVVVRSPVLYERSDRNG